MMRFLVSLVFIISSNLQIGDFRSIEQVLIHTSQKSFGPNSIYQEGGLFCYVCHPGFHFVRDCIFNLTTATCSKCPPGTYNSNYNIAHTCAACTTYCLDRHAEIIRHCNGTADAVCRCVKGYYNHSTGPGEWKCLPHTNCESGKEPYKIGNSTHDIICKPCENGYYSSVKSSISKCKPCSRCDAEHSVLSNCNITHDTVCVFSGKNREQSAQGRDPSIVIPIVIGTISTFIVVVVTVLLVLCLRRKRKNMQMCTRKDEKGFIEEAEGKRCDDSEMSLLVTPETVDAAWGDLQRKLIKIIPPNNWRTVCRCLLSNGCNMSQSEIDNKIQTFTINYQNDVEEQIYQSLKFWCQRAADTACLEDVISALRVNGVGDLNNIDRRFDILLKENISQISSEPN